MRKSSLVVIFITLIRLHWRIQGGRQGPAPLGLIFFFVQCPGKIMQNNKLAPPPLWLAPPSLGNPGSTTCLCPFGLSMSQCK